MHEQGLQRQVLINVAVATCIIVFCVHLPVLHSKAFLFDDHQYLFENKLVKTPSWESAWSFISEIRNPTTVEGYYQPITMISLMLDYSWAGTTQDLTQYHRTNLLLHIFNTLQVIIILYLLFHNPWSAGVVGLMFGIHPLTVDSIAWVSERKTLLATGFALFSLMQYIYYCRDGKIKWYLWSMGGYLLAVLSKPTVVVLPILFCLVDVWPLKRKNVLAFAEKLPFIALMLVSSTITLVSQFGITDSIGSVKSETAFSPFRIGYCIVFYIRKIIWPTELSCYYQTPFSISWKEPEILQSTILASLLLFVILAFSRWSRAFIITFLFLLISLIPTMGIIKYTFSIVANRYMYFPLVGLAIFVSKAISKVCLKGRTFVITTALILGLIIGLEVFATRSYLVKWRDTQTLYEHMLNLSPNAVQLHNDIGNVLLSAGRYDAAIDHYKTIVALDPIYPGVRNNWGYASMKKGQYDTAIALYKQELELYSDNIKAHTNLGDAHRLTGDLDKAMKSYEAVQRIEKDRPRVLEGMAWIWAAHPDKGKRDLKLATMLARKALSQGQTRRYLALSAIAAVHAERGEFTRASVLAETAYELAVEDNNLAIAQEIQDRFKRYGVVNATDSIEYFPALK